MNLEIIFQRIKRGDRRIFKKAGRCYWKEIRRPKKSFAYISKVRSSSVYARYDGYSFKFRIK